MPILGSFAAGSGKGFGLTAGAAAPVVFNYLVVAGGGGGGNATAAGGGGAGGYRTAFPGGKTTELEPGSYPITIGAAGQVAQEVLKVETGKLQFFQQLHLLAVEAEAKTVVKTQLNLMVELADLVAAEEIIIRAKVLTLTQAELETLLQQVHHKEIQVEQDKLTTHLNTEIGAAAVAVALTRLERMLNQGHQFLP